MQELDPKELLHRASLYKGPLLNSRGFAQTVSHLLVRAATKCRQLYLNGKHAEKGCVCIKIYQNKCVSKPPGVFPCCVCFTSQINT